MLSSGCPGRWTRKLIIFFSSIHRILFEKRQANDAIELLRVLTRSSGVTLEIHRDMDSTSGGVGDPVQVTLLRQGSKES